VIYNHALVGDIVAPKKLVAIANIIPTKRKSSLLVLHVFSSSHVQI